MYKTCILLIHIGTNGEDWEQKPIQVMEMLDSNITNSVDNNHPMTLILHQIIKPSIEEDSSKTVQVNRDLT
jgi:hypothetical protein